MTVRGLTYSKKESRLREWTGVRPSTSPRAGLQNLGRQYATRARSCKTLGLKLPFNLLGDRIQSRQA